MVDGASMDGLVFAASNFSIKASMEACDAVVEKGRARETTEEDRLAARARARRVEAMGVGRCVRDGRARAPAPVVRGWPCVSV